MKFFLINNLRIILCFILVLGVARFIYATSFKDNNSLFKGSYALNAYSSYIIDHNENKELQGRKLGPIAVILISGIKKLVPENYTSFIWRLGLFISFGIIIYFLVDIISEFKLILQKNNTHLWSILLVLVSLQ